MAEIPVLKIGDCLLVSIQVDMHDRLAMALQDDLTNRIVADRARGHTLVELGLSLTGVRTALNVDKGLALIRREIDDQGGALGRRREI
jgi:rsbT antagonist protein RsbS